MFKTQLYFCLCILVEKSQASQNLHIYLVINCIECMHIAILIYSVQYSIVDNSMDWLHTCFFISL